MVEGQCPECHKWAEDPDNDLVPDDDGLLWFCRECAVKLGHAEAEEETPKDGTL
jgi:hypothetical protein